VPAPLQQLPSRFLVRSLKHVVNEDRKHSEREDAAAVRIDCDTGQLNERAVERT
jgi:hypothetical protein